MKRLFLIWLIFSFVYIPSAQATGEELAIVDAIQKRYESARTFKAKFFQKSYIKMMDQVQEAKGDVLIKKPGKMRWTYRAPDPQTLVTNNKTLWLYVPEDNQVIKTSVKNIYSSNTPALFLAGQGKLKETFDILSVKQDNNRIVAELVPKKKEQGLARLVLYVDRENYQIIGSSVYDKLGNKTEMIFMNIQVNMDIPEDVFEFKIPEGAFVIDQTQTSDNE